MCLEDTFAPQEFFPSPETKFQKEIVFIRAHVKMFSQFQKCNHFYDPTRVSTTRAIICTSYDEGTFCEILELENQVSMHVLH